MQWIVFLLALVLFQCRCLWELLPPTLHAIRQTQMQGSKSDLTEIQRTQEKILANCETLMKVFGFKSHHDVCVRARVRLSLSAEQVGFPWH